MRISAIVLVWMRILNIYFNNLPLNIIRTFLCEVFWPSLMNHVGFISVTWLELQRLSLYIYTYSLIYINTNIFLHAVKKGVY